MDQSSLIINPAGRWSVPGPGRSKLPQEVGGLGALQRLNGAWRRTPPPKATPSVARRQMPLTWSRQTIAAEKGARKEEPQKRRSSSASTRATARSTALVCSTPDVGQAVTAAPLQRQASAYAGSGKRRRRSRMRNSLPGSCGSKTRTACLGLKIVTREPGQAAPLRHANPQVRPPQPHSRSAFLSRCTSCPHAPAPKKGRWRAKQRWVLPELIESWHEMRIKTAHAARHAQRTNTLSPNTNNCRSKPCDTGSAHGQGNAPATKHGTNARAAACGCWSGPF